MKLYCFRPSHNSRRVLATLAALDTDVEIEEKNIFQGEHKVPEIQNNNITGRLPLLVDGDFSLWESNAIMQYLVEKFGPSSLYPQDPEQRADVNRWLCWQMSHFNSPTSTFLFQNLLKPILGAGEPDQAKLTSAAEDFKTCATHLETQLNNRKFVCGDEMTLADISIASCVAYADEASMPWSGYNNCNAWYDRMAQTDAWKKTEPDFNPEELMAVTS